MTQIPYEFTPFQQWARGLGQGWFRDLMVWWSGTYEQSPCEVVDRWLDTRTVSSTTPMPWPITHEGIRLEISPMTDLWANSYSGVPMQRAGDQRTSYTRWDTMVHGSEAGPKVTQESIPVPKGGAYWVEGYPAIGGAWDRHSIIAADDGRITEIIGMNPLLGRFLVHGVWVDGELVEGDPVCAAGVPMSGILTNRWDPPHVMGIVMDDYGGGDGSKDWGFPRCGDRVALSSTAAERLRSSADAEQRLFIDAAEEHGFVIYDKSGGTGPRASLGQVAGRQWAGTTLHRLDIRLRDLDLVTA